MAARTAGSPCAERRGGSRPLPAAGKQLRPATARRVWGRTGPGSRAFARESAGEAMMRAGPATPERAGPQRIGCTGAACTLRRLPGAVGFGAEIPAASGGAAPPDGQAGRNRAGPCADGIHQDAPGARWPARRSLRRKLGNSARVMGLMSKRARFCLCQGCGGGWGHHAHSDLPSRGSPGLPDGSRTVLVGK